MFLINVSKPLLFITFIIFFGAANIFVYKKLTGKYRTFPVVVNTWNFQNATKRAWEMLYIQNKTAIDAIEAGITVCEMEQCGLTVGYGGSPDEHGETTLDAMIIDGININVGAVGGLRYIKTAVSVARRVLENTEHTLLGGDLATKFALEMGFLPDSLATNTSTEIWKKWIENSCQPNFRTNVLPDPTKQCGPYKPPKFTSYYRKDKVNFVSKYAKTESQGKSHDTITMLALDKYGNIAAGGSTNGLSHKIPGRIGDTPVPGAGAYADNAVGAASATGNGDIMMRFVPSFLAVEEMRRGASPKAAALTAVNRIRSHYPDFYGAVIAINIYGEFGAACSGMMSFHYCAASPTLKNVTVYKISC